MTDDTSAALERLKEIASRRDDGVAMCLWSEDARAILAHIAVLEARAEKAEAEASAWTTAFNNGGLAGLRAALEKISGPHWSVFYVDSPAASIAAQIIDEMQRTAREALAAASAAPESRERELDKRRLDGLRELCGYVEDGSETSVNISQDDATRDWIIRAGKRWWHGKSLREAIDAALQPTSKGDE